MARKKILVYGTKREKVKGKICVTFGRDTILAFKMKTYRKPEETEFRGVTKCYDAIEKEYYYKSTIFIDGNRYSARHKTAREAARHYDLVRLRHGKEPINNTLKRTI